MKFSLDLKVQNQLAITPQLQKAISLLNMSSVELSQEIQKNIYNNPLLESEEVNEFPEVNARENFDYNSYFKGSSNKNEYSLNILENIDKSSSSLKEHLLWQLNLTPFSEEDRLIALCVIDYVDESGFLTESMDYLAALLKNYSRKNIATVIKRIQHFDPVGVCCFDLVESLLVQLQQVRDNPFKKEAGMFLQEIRDSVKNISLESVFKKLSLKDGTKNGMIDLIKQLNPDPGSLIHPQETSFIVPDVIMKRKENSWAVFLNPCNNPKLYVNKSYASLLNSNIDSQDQVYIKNNLQEAKWFIRSLENRNDTLLKVSQAIIDVQKKFFLFGEEAMVPLVLEDLSAQLNVHGSTISRITTQKYIHTPRGMFELKYFFSSHLSTSNGVLCSSTAIRALIKKIIASEDPRSPFSDNKISKILTEQGFFVARRTVAKYRDSMMIASSINRKML